MAKSIAEKLKNAGVDAARGVVTFADADAFHLIIDKKSALYDPRVDEDLDEALVQDIDDNGVQTPILVRENGVMSGRPCLEVIAGRRRVRHTRVANRRRHHRNAPPHRIPFFTVHGDDGEMLLLALRENAHRKGETVMSLAWKVRAALGVGRSHEEVAAACGVGVARVEKLLTFLNLSAAAQKAVESGEVPLGSIESIAAVPRDQQAKFLATLRETGATKNHEVKAAAEAAVTGKKYTPPDRKRAWGRREMKAFVKVLEAGAKNKETIVARSLLDFMQGDDSALDELPTLKAAASTMRRQLKKK